LIQQKIARFGLSVLALAAAGVLLTANEASAKGCNGVVNAAVWGCAPWDNNNGPQFPNYKKPAKAQPQAKVAAPSATAPRHDAQLNSGGNIISRDGAGIVSNDGATLRR
jgi:hypothetical protein